MSKIIRDVDILVHAAAYPHEGLSSFSPYLICKSNYIGSISVFTAAIQNNVKRIVFVPQCLDMEMCKRNFMKKKK